MTALEAARAYVAAGLSVIPIRPDGSKSPPVPWGPYQRRKPSDAELQYWFAERADWGLAVVCGAVSRNLEVLDFDTSTIWEQWRRVVLGIDPKALDGIASVRTPRGGRHLYLFRQVAGPNRKLAKDEWGHTLIEVRGEGGYALAPGCPPACHPSGLPYVWDAPLAGVA